MNVYGLIGFPLEHSFSKDYFTNKFQKESINDSLFELFPISDISQFKSFVYSIDGLKGLSVTIPYKESIIPFLDGMDEKSKQVGAVNCVRVSDGKLFGYNTDVIGFENSFMPLREYHHQKALILGTGGASKAVKFVLSKYKIPFLQVSRNHSVECDFISYDMVDESLLNEYNIVINCSPIGMYPAIDKKPAIPYHYVSKHHLLFDLIYNPAETLFLKEGKRHGAIIKNGYDMLVTQAEESWKIWQQKENS